MLEKATEYAKKEGLSNIRLPPAAGSMVEMDTHMIKVESEEA